MSINFAVLAMARTGSSYLSTALRNHPNVCMHGEIMHNNTSGHIREHVRNQLDLSIRDRDPIKFVNEIYKLDGGKKAVGFKIWKHQSPEAVEYIIKNKSIKKIVLERRNLLASFSSREIAQKTNIWGLNIDKVMSIKQYETPKISFSQKRFSNYVDNSLDVYKFYKHELESGQQDYLLVDYQKHIMNGNLNIVSEFLEIDTSFDLVGKKVKLNQQSNILDRFVPEDHQKIIQYLSKINKTDWIHEKSV